MANLAVNIARLKLKNPVILVSGTFSEELGHLLDLRKIGAIVTKTITLKPHSGNPPPRTCETFGGLINSIGLENPGLENFIREKLPILKKIGTPIIVSISALEDSKEFVLLAKYLDKIKEISAIELNISCPNIRKINNKLISQDKGATYELVKKVRKVTTKTLITKLSPNVTDIRQIAYAAQKAGSDAISLINTITALSVNIYSRRPKLATTTGGLSGPAIKPIALRMVWETFQEVNIPIIGMGGIMNSEDALEFIICGATAVGVGTANFVDPSVSLNIIDGIKNYLIKNKIRNIKELIGTLKV